MAYKKIDDYGVIGDGDTAALIGRDGSIDWLCLPYLDSPSVFGALLDEFRGGRFSVRPAGRFDSAQRYVEATNVLSTIMRCPQGELEVVDFMPTREVDDAKEGATRLVRKVHVSSGALDIAIACSPRFDYGRIVPIWEHPDSRTAIARAGGSAICLQSSVALSWDEESACLAMSAGESLWLVLTPADSAPHALDERELAAQLDATIESWRAWLRAGDIGRYQTGGFWERQLQRSALVLKLLQMRSTGAVAAAATTSLPAIVHGERNWDYRFSWIRDSSMTVATLFELGHHADAMAYVDWVRRVLEHDDSAKLEIVYRLREPEPPIDETELGHLSGYKGSSPVRVGQYVVNQRQHDIYGELMQTLYLVSRHTGKLRLEHWRVFQPLVEQVIAIWREPDDGIWEARIGARHYTHSKLLCWVALDRGILIAEHYGFPADIARWTRERDELRREILDRGYDSARNTFTQHYETDAVDAALLLMPVLGFLPVDDPRVEGTIERIEKDLLRDGVMLRYVAQDGLQGQETGFMICLFWYLECLLLQGRAHEVGEYLRAIGRYANHLGLLGEQFDPRWDEITGNFPQAYSHIGYVAVVLKYLDARRAIPQATKRGAFETIALLWRKRVLNDACAAPVAGAPKTGRTGGAAVGSGNPAQDIKRAMNLLQANFYDGHARRVRYELIRDSSYYEVLQSAADRLSIYDPARLDSDAERIAFWVNVYNALVVHGVIELRIRDSVREVPRFFDRIAYRVGPAAFTADGIEHGLLRANAVPPWRLRKQWRGGDPRLAFAVRRPDPRIHFALVCASKTCPPIEVYEADSLDEQLHTSATVFINGTTSFDARSTTLSVSEVFKWYRGDFRRDGIDIARYVADHLYDDATRQAVRAAGSGLKIDFAPYDWRLNR